MTQSTTESRLTDRLAALSPEKRALLLQQLHQTKQQIAGSPDTIERLSRDNLVFPASFAQRRLWFLDQMEPGNPAYNLFKAVRLLGNLDVKALESSLNGVMQRHEALRTVFGVQDGEPVQIIQEGVQIALPVKDLTKYAKTEREAVVHELATAETNYAFNLSSGPLMRALLLRLKAQEHILFLIMHHIVSDGWSTGILIREMIALYEMAVRQLPTILPELPVQYADFSSWQRQWLSGPRLDSELAYWQQQLTAAPHTLALPTDYSRPPVQSFQGASHTFTVPGSLAKVLTKFSQQTGTTLFMTLLAVFNVLLYRYTNQQDLLVGTPIANRNRREIEDLIGFFVNTLVIRSQVTGRMRFRDLLQQVRNVTLDAYNHQDLPFELLVDALKLERDLSRSPLFQVMFWFQKMPNMPAVMERHDLILSPIEVESNTEKFDLTLFMTEVDGQLTGTITYSVDLFHADTIKRLAEHFLILLNGIMANPDQRISELPLLTKRERHQLLVDWPQTDVDYPHPQSLPQLFEAQVLQTPAALAIIFADQHISYQELNKQANKVAHALAARGTGPGKVVAIFMERSPEMVVALLGTLKTGAAYVALDPDYPKNRLSFMLADADVNLLLSQSHLRHMLPQHSNSVIYLDDVAYWQKLGTENLETPISPDSLAYIAYTSGSTGRPKGILSNHRSVVNHLTYVQQTYEIDPTHIVLQVAALSFDASVRDIMGPLLAGAQIALPTPEAARNPEALLGLIDKHQVTTILSSVPTVLRLLTEAAGTRRYESVRLILAAGEPLYWSDYRRARMTFAPDLRLVNQYGPTECTMTSGYYQVTERMSSDKEGMISIGKPIPNVRFYVLDSALNPVTVGVTGVLHIGGAGVSAGYHRLPGLTATRFIPDPFSDTPGKRLFDTGDLVRYRMDGNLDFLGRSDQLVKIHGVRIELGEIEAVLNRHASVAETAVIVRQDAADNPRLIAYVVWQPGAEATVAELRAFAAEHLPMSMIPSNFVVLNALPQTPNRKVDRQALPVPEQDRDILEVAYVPPQTAQEAALAEIWSNLLGIYRVGIHDNFFHLGGDSLLAMRVVLEANRVGLGVTIKQLFMHQTIAGLASVATTPQTIHAVQEPVTGTLPLNHIQQDFLNRGYNLKYWMTGPVLAIPDCQPRLLRQATEAIWQHHDMLRLRVVHDTSGWQQFIAEPNEEVPFQIVDLSGQPEVSQGYNALEKLITGDALDWLEPLEMAKGPLFQALLYDTGHGNPHYLLLFCHYLTADPTSWRIVAEDLHTAYKQLQQELAIKLPPKTTSYKYYTEQLATFAQTEKVKQEASYWLSARWQQAPVLPTDHCLGPNHMKSRQSYTVALSLEETQALLAIAHEGFLLQDVLATALVLTLQRWLQSSTLLVGIQGHGRITSFPEVDLTRTVGWFAHRTPVLFQLEKNMGDDEAVQTVSEQLAAALERGTNYGTLRYLCRDETITQGLQRMPQPQITFNNFGEIDAPSSRKDDSDLFQLVGSVWGDRSDPLAVRSTQLSILPRLFGKQLFVNWLYSDNYYRQETIAHWAGNMLTTLQRLIGCRRED